MAWSTYLAGIRALIGDRLLLTPAAGVAVFDESGSLLLLRHRHDGLWGTPGGGMEPGEAPEETARREVLEETSLRLPRLHLVGGFGGQEFVVDYGGGPSTAYAVFLYGCVVPRSDVVLQLDEVVEAGWFSASEIVSLGLPPDMEVMIPAALSWYDAVGAGPRPAASGRIASRRSTR